MGGGNGAASAWASVYKSEPQTLHLKNFKTLSRRSCLPPLIPSPPLLHFFGVGAIQQLLKKLAAPAVATRQPLSRALAYVHTPRRPPMPRSAAGMPALPAGFRFHPTDEELVAHYLARQAAGAPCPAPVVAEANIYACDPWELLVPAIPAARERYFFSPRDRKYPNGARPNRAAGGGYWKATGTDKPVVSERAVVGVKKALVFYSGRPPRGVKTDWVMHEYRLVAGAAGHNNNKDAAGNKTKRSCRGASSSSMRLDDWVLCRIYNKSNDFSSGSLHRPISDQEQEEASSTVEQEDDSLANNINSAATLASSASPKSEARLDQEDGHHQFRQSQKTPATTMSRSCSLTELLNTIDCSALAQMLLPDGGPDVEDAHAEPLLYYYPELGATPHTHQQQPLINYDNNSNSNSNAMNGSSHLISNSLLPPRVDACYSSDYYTANCSGDLKRKRTMTAMDGPAGSSLDDDGSSSKELKLLPSDPRNPDVGSYRNQLLVDDTNNTAAGFQFQFQPSCSLTTSYNPFLQMQQ
ncbi:hypothetical protein BS78_05G022800 [Paspalum vaginatum]|nr:hypothetical protein BS78_05G022800 [Paspalum vaginatum]